MIEKNTLVLLVQKKKKFLVRAEDRKFHTHCGILNLGELSRVSYGSVLKTHSGKEFRVLKPNFIDFTEKMRKMPQVIQPKDAAMIVAITGLKRGCRVLEAGTGSGALTIFLACVVEPSKVISYERNQQFLEIARKNIEDFGLENVVLKNKDIYDGIEEEDLDLVALDLSEPERVVEDAMRALRFGGFIFSYSPSIEQVKRFLREAVKFSEDIKILECLVREWEFSKALRPKTRMLGHTGFMSFVRKV
ncbi:MAG: tRNA (adenine-N1)-methyltransferase [Candidatus Methanofastidiosia archaeon]